MLENLMEAVPADETGERLLDKTEALGEELDRVEGYIEQALFFARSESLDRDYLIRAYGLQKLVGDAVRANARVLMGAHVSPFRVGLDHTVFTDEKWMTFILGQLIQNSAKYAQGEGAEIVFTSRLIDEGRSSERIELEVRDNGCGVSESDLPRVFDRGFTGGQRPHGQEGDGHWPLPGQTLVRQDGSDRAGGLSCRRVLCRDHRVPHQQDALLRVGAGRLRGVGRLRVRMLAFVLSFVPGHQRFVLASNYVARVPTAIPALSQANDRQRIFGASPSCCVPIGCLHPRCATWAAGPRTRCADAPNCSAR